MTPLSPNLFIITITSVKVLKCSHLATKTGEAPSFSLDTNSYCCSTNPVIFSNLVLITRNGVKLPDLQSLSIANYFNEVL